jgi:hypothetical protein
VFINLDGSKERRAAVEASFARAPHEGWTLERFPAVAPGPRTTGAMPLGAQGCFLSHLDVLAASLDDEAPVFIVEDDVVFSKETFGLVGQLLSARHEWDLLFTDAIVLELTLLARMARQRRELMAEGRRVLFNAAAEPCAGSTAYVVRGPAKRRLYEALQESDLSRPYDLYLRGLMHQGRFRAGLVFPFVTSVAPAGDRSQIDAADDRDVWRATLNLFRRLMFVERDLDQCRRDAEALLANADEEGRVLGAVVAGLTSPGFPVASDG